MSQLNEGSDPPKTDEVSPIKSLQVAAEYGMDRLDVISYGFSDKIMILISKNGSLGKMYYIPLTGSPVQQYAFNTDSTGEDDDFSLLAPSHITPTPILGASHDDVEGHIYAAQIAALIGRQNPDERRLVVVGLPYLGPRTDNEILTMQARGLFLDILQLVSQVRIW
ncbi:hypothetical protein V1514DRAFT_340784 [Lipomyces japonicus]|uniref:uncharacterized protein n=1 Tax=Lipomyces japonicus TaxID=56871 RepID=UPI0034CF34F9